MRNAGFQRFVAIFVGVMLAFGVTAAIITHDDGMIGTAIAVGGLYLVYLVLFFKKEKERREERPKEKVSPLLRR